MEKTVEFECTEWLFLLVGLLLLLCLGVLVEWVIYRLRLIWPLSPSMWRARFRSWRYARSVKGLTIRSVSGKGPSNLGSLRVTRQRWEELNGPPDVHGDEKP
jgi:hypothetical protein